MSCAHCNDTGSLSKDIGGHLDCTHCGAAQQRTALEAWFHGMRNRHDVIDLLWLAFQRGQGARAKLIAALEMVRDADDDAGRDGLPRIPRMARATIDTALTAVGAA